MVTRPLAKADYDEIVQVIDRWWGGPTSALAHPIFFYELGRMARVVESDGHLVGFLFGFVCTDPVYVGGSAGSAASAGPAPKPPVHDGPSAPRAPVGYVHLVGIHPDYRRRGVGKLLYASFEDDCRREGVKELKALTTLGNEASVRFHQALGWSVAEVEDYA